MRAAILALIAGITLGVVTVSPQAAPFTPAINLGSVNIHPVWGGCGWGFHPVPGHWSRWRGEWVPPHCAPNHNGYYGGGSQYYGGGTPPYQYYGGGTPYQYYGAQYPYGRGYPY